MYSKNIWAKPSYGLFPETNYFKNDFDTPENILLLSMNLYSLISDFPLLFSI